MTNNTRQIIAGLKKEWCFFWKKFHFLAFVLIFIACALFFPVLSGMVQAMNDSFGLILEDVPDLEEGAMSAVENFDKIAEMYTLELTYNGTLGMLQMAVILLTVLLIGTAGAEQKKRSIIMPQTAGLTPAGYVLPKFMLYPPMVFAASVIAVLLSNVACQAVYNESYSMQTTLLAGTIVGVFAAFSVCFYLFMGISLVQPGLSILYVAGANLVFGGLITSIFRIDRFTPWNLLDMATLLVTEQRMGINAIIATMVITLVLCVVFMLATLFAMIAKQVDNTADEVY